MNEHATRQCLALCVLLLATVSSVLAGDVTPQQLRERGLAALKAAQSDEARIVEAARYLSQAADAYAAAGNDGEAQELGAYLYWAKKKMSLQQMDAFLTGGEPEKKVAARLEAIASAKPEASEAKARLQKAEAFLTANPGEPLLCAIRFYEVADRFAGTPESLEAQRKSLDLMQKVKATAPVAAPKQTQEPLVGGFRFGSWELSLPQNPADLVDAAVGKWWYTSPTIVLQQLPPYLLSCKLVQQKAGHPWLAEVRCNRPIVVYAAVRLSIKRASGNELSMTEQSFQEMATRGGWKQTGGPFKADSPNETWVWRVIGKALPPGTTTIENPFPTANNLCAVFFIEPPKDKK